MSIGTSQLVHALRGEDIPALVLAHLLQSRSRRRVKHEALRTLRQALDLPAIQPSGPGLHPDVHADPAEGRDRLRHGRRARGGFGTDRADDLAGVVAGCAEVVDRVLEQNVRDGEAR